MFRNRDRVWIIVHILVSGAWLPTSWTATKMFAPNAHTTGCRLFEPPHQPEDRTRRILFPKSRLKGGASLDCLPLRTATTTTGPSSPSEFDEASICFLTESLPPEIRERIYRHVLPTGVLHIQSWTHASDPNRRRKRHLTALLQTCRRINREAITVLYDLNTIAVQRDVFCERTTTALPFRPQLIRHLLIPAVRGPSECERSGDQIRRRYFRPLTNGTWPNYQEIIERIPCARCTSPLLDFVTDLALLPRLQRVTIEYDGDMKVIYGLRQSLSQVDRPGSLRCVNIGVYMLDCPLSGIKVMIKNSPLFAAWDLHMGLSKPPYAPDSVDREVLLSRPSKVICKMACENNIPQALASVWPSDIPRDLRIVNIIAGYPVEYRSGWKQGMNLRSFRVEKQHQSFLEALHDILQILTAPKDIDIDWEGNNWLRGFAYT